MGTLTFQATLGGSVNLLGPNTAATVNLTLPSADGTSGQALQTNGSGTLSFATLGIGGGGTGLTSFTANQIHYGSFSQSAGLTFDGTNFATTGTATATKLIPTGTSVTGNGMYLPATNSVGISTAGTNAVYIDASQNVGIGQTSPQAKLQINTAADGAQIIVVGAQTANEQTLLFRNSYYTNNTTSGLAAIGWIDSGSSGGSLTFKTGVNGGGVTNIPTEKVRIDNAGNVGIGTSSPATKLHIKGSLALGSIRSESTGDVTTTGYNYISFYDTSGQVGYVGYAGAANSYDIVNNLASGFLTFKTGGYTERMRIDSSGNVGIGTTTPSRPLVVYGASNSYLALQNSTTGVANTDGLQLIQDTTTGYLYQYENMPLVFGTNATERMRIDSSGNLLVGCTVTNPIASRVNGIATGGVGFITSRSANNMALGVSGTSGSHIQCYTDNGTTYVSAGSITSSGSVTSFNVTSDYRLKQNVQPMTSTLSLISQLKPCSFEYIEGNQYSEGFIAHELQAIVPHAVTGEKDAIDADGKPVYQAVDSSFLIPHLVAAMQEQQALITSLTARITALEAK